MKSIYQEWQVIVRSIVWLSTLLRSVTLDYPELMGPENPLTFSVLDEQGEPIDHLKGSDIKGDSQVASVTHNILFKTPLTSRIFGPDARLPQFLGSNRLAQQRWHPLRHSHLFIDSSFKPIRPDFSDADEGTYRFYGYCQ